MSRRAASPKAARGIASRLRNRKVIAVIAGTTALVVLAVVLILTTLGAPDDNGVPGSVLARVNGEAITREDVASMQKIVLQWDGVWVEAEEVLEQLVSQRLLFREAESRDYVPIDGEVEVELLTRLAILRIPIEELHAMLEETGLSYQEFLEHRKVQLAITAFLDNEIEQPEVTEEEVMQAYEEYKELYRQMFPDQEPPPFEEMKSQVITAAEGQKRQEAISLFIEKLREKAEIEYMQSE